MTINARIFPTSLRYDCIGHASVMFHCTCDFCDIGGHTPRGSTGRVVAAGLLCSSSSS